MPGTFTSATCEKVATQAHSHDISTFQGVFKVPSWPCSAADPSVYKLRPSPLSLSLLLLTPVMFSFVAPRPTEQATGSSTQNPWI